METKLKEVAQTVISALAEHRVMDDFIDSVDQYATEVPDGKVTFEMTKNFDRPNPGHSGRGPGGHMPIGHIVYTVTIEGKYVSYDDEG